MLKQLGWWDDLTEQEKTAAEGRNWKTDLSGGIQRVAIKHGCAPFGNAKARCVVLQFPDPVRITSYNVCYTKLLRLPDYTGYPCWYEYCAGNCVLTNEGTARAT